MKQKNQQQSPYKLLYFQEQFNRENAETIPLIGLGREIISINNKIGIALSQQFKEGQVMLMKSIGINEEQLKEILTEYLSDEEQKKYIFERNDDQFDQFNIFKHFVNETYIAILPRGLIVQFIKEEQLEKINLENAEIIIKDHLKFLNLDENDTKFHRVRILQNIRSQLIDELPKLEKEEKQQEFNNIEEKVIYENEMKYFKGKGLFEIPTFNKELLYYNWDNMQQIPKKLCDQL